MVKWLLLVLVFPEFGGSYVMLPQSFDTEQQCLQAIKTSIWRPRLDNRTVPQCIGVSFEVPDNLKDQVQ